jgi:hypothetical protein
MVESITVAAGILMLLLLKQAAPMIPQTPAPLRTTRPAATMLPLLQMSPTALASTINPTISMEHTITAPLKPMRLTAWTMLMVESTTDAAGMLPQMKQAAPTIPQTPAP